MQIFLSYASDAREKAEPLAFALRERGHTVFLDRDGLAAGGSFNSLIETEIKESDLMVFLVSPSSVAPGRFTLSEVEFARHHWRSAKNRVLPVMIEPTELAAIPAFLRAVNIMEPKGNMVAEVSAAVDRLRGFEYAMFVALQLGLISLCAGLLTWFSYDAAGKAYLRPFVGNFGPIAAPQNALLFAFPIAFGAWWWGHRRWWVFAVPFVVVAISYLAIAPTISRYTAEVGSKSQRDPTLELEQLRTVVEKIKQQKFLADGELKLLEHAQDEIKDINIKYKRVGVAFLVACVLAAGAMLGLSLVLPAFRSVFRWLAVGVVATAMSIAATFIILAGDDKHTLWKGVSLFTAWLVVFGALFGYWLARGRTSVSG